MMRSSTK